MQELYYGDNGDVKKYDYFKEQVMNTNIVFKPHYDMESMVDGWASGAGYTKVNSELHIDFYTKDNCMNCKNAKILLGRYCLEYTEHSILENMDLADKFGAKEAPLILIDNVIPIVGYNVPKIRAIFEYLTGAIEYITFRGIMGNEYQKYLDMSHGEFCKKTTKATIGGFESYITKESDDNNESRLSYINGLIKKGYRL